MQQKIKKCNITIQTVNHNRLKACKNKMNKKYSICSFQVDGQQYEVMVHLVAVYKCT